jgi:hypothetical protein
MGIGEAMTATIPVRTCTDCGARLAPHEVTWVRREPGSGLRHYDPLCRSCVTRRRKEAPCRT